MIVVIFLNYKMILSSEIVIFRKMYLQKKKKLQKLLLHIFLQLSFFLS